MTPGSSRVLRGLLVAGFVLAVGGVMAAKLGRVGRSAMANPGRTGLAQHLAEAERANAAHDIQEERAILLRAEKLGGSSEEVFEVQRRLAVLDWKCEERFDEARNRLLRATETTEAFDAWLAIARLEQARRRFEEAASAARNARELATSGADADESRVALARAAVAHSVSERLAGKDGASEALRESFGELRDMVHGAAGHLEPSRLLLQAGLILEEGPTALSAWRSYFHVTSEDPGPNLVAEAGVELEALLPSWPGSGMTEIDLISALSSSRLFTEAALVALGSSATEAREDPWLHAVVRYVRFLREAGELTEKHYRQTILGNDTRRSWQGELRSALQPLAEILEDGSLPPLGTPASLPVDPGRAGDLDRRVLQQLASSFGAYISIGTTAGYFDLHMGHLVSDETRVIEQYGRRAELRFLVLDNMVSNGFQSWAWESGAQHGGWNKPYGIFQVRPAYVGGGRRAWRRLHSEDELEELSDEMERESRLDEERASRDPHAHLPGLALRLEHQGLMNLRSELQARGLEGDELKIAFLAEYDQAVLESSIFAHEGRHAIDKRYRSVLSFSRNSELTAKLSEVAFAPRPRLALGAIISPTIGDRTPHGRANLEIMKGLVSWMGRHRNEIRGLDAERPLLPQLDLLSDEQLRQAFRSMDRLAGNE